jgi:PRC-barrel domain
MHSTQLGPPVGYPAVRDGTPVYDRAGVRIGVVDHVVADDAADIFEGLIVHTLPLPGRHLFADADQIAELRERGVILAVPAGELHDPGDRRARQAAPVEPVENPLQSRLRRAWDWILEHGEKPR